LFQYIEKPWDNDQLKLVIRNALANKSLIESLNEKLRDLDQMLRQRDSLVERQKLFQKELSLARKLQEKTLPRSLPKVNGLSFAAKYIPALEIGGEVAKRDDAETALIDIREIPISIADAGEDIKDAKFSETINRADALIIIAPEYNHGYPGLLKHMLDTNLRNISTKPLASGVFLRVRLAAHVS